MSEHSVESKRFTKAKNCGIVTIIVKKHAYLFFDNNDRFEFIKQGQRVNQHCYIDMLTKLCDWTICLIHQIWQHVTFALSQK